MDPLALAEHIARTASALGIPTAVIGAAALAVHNFVRATEDVDLLTCVELGADLRRLEAALEDAGFKVRLNTPDDEDDLGGVLRVWEREDEDGDPIDSVDVVNFLHPYRHRITPARAALRNAKPLDDKPDGLRYVALPDLVALKLDAGSTFDHGDVVRVLAQNPDADLEQIRAAASPFDRGGVLERLIAEAEAIRAKPPER